MSITLLIHGGSGTIKASDRENYHAGLRVALTVGYEVLEQSGSALEAVLAAVTTMENDENAFNAGIGGSPNRDGVVECDAAVMLGRDGSSGAVAGLTVARNPILIADKVRRETPHVFFVGEGANTLVEKKIANSELLTKRSREGLKRWRERGGKPTGSATVGAVALDANGELAAATSTGGVLGKWPGRVGDSPLIGAGTYANPQVAISCTGKGEAFVRAVSAKEIAMRLHYGEALEDAVQGALENIKHFDGSGGLICLTRDGELCASFNAPHMAYAWKTQTVEKIAVGLEPGLYHP